MDLARLSAVRLLTISRFTSNSRSLLASFIPASSPYKEHLLCRPRGRTLRATRAFRTVFRMNREDDVFATFSCLPFELRCQIWEEAVPGPGIFLVE